MEGFAHEGGERGEMLRVEAVGGGDVRDLGVLQLQGEFEVAEGVRDGAAVGLGVQFQRGGLGRGFGLPAAVGELVETGEEARGWALLEIEVAGGGGDEPRGGGVVGELLFRSFARVGGLVAMLVGLAPRGDRADEALRVCGRADLRAEFHNGVGVEAGLGRRGELPGEGAQGLAGGGERLFHLVEAGEDALDVAIHHICGRIEGGGGEHGGGVGAEAGEAQEFGFGSRKLAVVLGDKGLGALMQQVRAAVVAEALPVVEDVGDRGLGQALQGGEALQKPLVVGNNRGDGGLLEHDLGQPDVVGRGGGVSPRHGTVAARVPGQQSGLELLWRNMVGRVHIC